MTQASVYTRGSAPLLRAIGVQRQGSWCWKRLLREVAGGSGLEGTPLPHSRGRKSRLSMQRGGALKVSSSYSQEIQ
jgi:hypothetical protein